MDALADDATFRATTTELPSVDVLPWVLAVVARARALGFHGPAVVRRATRVLVEVVVTRHP